jgi:hypothetical protein
MQDLNLRPVASSSKSTSAKPIPTRASLDPWDFNYIPSPDGKDANLMIMFHGLGELECPLHNCSSGSFAYRCLRRRQRILHWSWKDVETAFDSSPGFTSSRPVSLADIA